MATIVIPKISEYGARELKEQIRKYTYRAFIYVIGSLALLIVLFFTVNKIQEASRVAPMMAPIVKTEIVDLPQQANDQKVDVPPPPPAPTIISSGPAVRAGTPVPVPDAELSPDLQDFATTDVLSRASAEGGDGVDLGNFSSNIKFGDEKIVVTKEQEIPDEDEFIAVEQEVEVDIAKLQQLIVYPEMAKRAGIDGRVVISIFVGPDGVVKKTKIVQSDNELLNQAAIDAIKKYGKFPPAIQNKQPVGTWTTIPLVFRLQ